MIQDKEAHYPFFNLTELEENQDRNVINEAKAYCTLLRITIKDCPTCISKLKKLTAQSETR